MASNQSNKKISTRHKKTDSEKLGIRSVPGEVVEIERNIIENWLISLKHWFHVNTATARKIIFGFLMVMVLFFIVVFTHSAVIEKQNSQYYSILLSYEKLKEDSGVVKIDAGKLKKLQEHSDKLCNTTWSTRYSNNGCLLSAIFSNEAGNKKETADFLMKFSKAVHNRAFAAYTTFLSAYFYESNKELDKSIDLYKKLDTLVDEKTGRDFTLFHTGRLYYYSDKLTEAEKSFKEILEKYKSSPYSANAKNYLLLVQLKKALPAGAK